MFAIYLQPGAETMSCLETLKSRGCRLTPQRRLIIEIIHDAGSHLTAEEIINHVQKRMPGVNKSTIYRTLELLEQYNCVIRSEKDDRFIYHHAEDGHHHHLVCTNCGATIECNEDLFAPLEKRLAETYRFKVEFQHMVIPGLCPSCQIKNG